MFHLYTPHKGFLWVTAYTFRNYKIIWEGFPHKYHEMAFKELCGLFFPFIIVIQENGGKSRSSRLVPQIPYSLPLIPEQNVTCRFGMTSMFPMMAEREK